MGTSNWQPKWWSKDTHERSWDRVKEALKRDWEQTKNDFHAGGRDLDQDVDDTVKQAAGKDAIPAPRQPNAVGGTPRTAAQSWNDVEIPIRYGVGARAQYGAEHRDWDDKLEGKLRADWEDTKDAAHAKWNDVKDDVRRGYERARS